MRNLSAARYRANKRWICEWMTDATRKKWREGKRSALRISARSLCRASLSRFASVWSSCKSAVSALREIKLSRDARSLEFSRSSNATHWLDGEVSGDLKAGQRYDDHVGHARGSGEEKGERKARPQREICSLRGDFIGIIQLSRRIKLHFRGSRKRARNSFSK